MAETSSASFILPLKMLPGVEPTFVEMCRCGQLLLVLLLLQESQMLMITAKLRQTGLAPADGFSTVETRLVWKIQVKRNCAIVFIMSVWLAAILF